MATIGFYFRGMDKDQVNAMRARLNNIAARFSYTAAWGPTSGQGNAAEMLRAIDDGELALVLLPDEQRWMVTAWLQEQAEQQSGPLAEALNSIANALFAAQQRQDEIDAAELAEYDD